MSVIGIDYGGKRIGIAVSDSGLLASPHSVVVNDDNAIAHIAALGAEIDADTYVVGVARRAHSTSGEAKFHRFADALRQRTCKPVVLWDETLSTVEAAQRLRERGRKRSSHDQIDMYAAAVILQSWLDRSPGRSS